MAAFDATESLTPFHDDRGSGEYGAILFDSTQLRQVDPRWFDPEQWGMRAQRVDGSGRGGAWFIEASHGPCVLRQYLRGGLAATFAAVEHLEPMMSLDNAFSTEEVERWYARLGGPTELLCEVKIDGLALDLVYRLRRML